MFKQLLEKVASERVPGPSPTFSVLHLLWAIELMAEKSIGRSKLAEGLHVGEGAVRTILGRLKNARLVSTSKTGCALTDNGLRLWKEYRSIFKKKADIGKIELGLADYNLAILVKGLGHKVKSGVEQRDAAVMAGAKGATTVVFKKGHLVIPSVSSNVVNDFPKAANRIISLLEPNENDVIIIGSANSLAKAEYGTLAAAWTLLNSHG